MEEKNMSKKTDNKENERVEKKTIKKQTTTKQAKQVKKPQSAKAKDTKPQATKQEEKQDVKAQATKVKQIKVESKPVNSGYTRVKSIKQAQKGKSGIILLIIMIIILAIYFLNIARNYSILTSLDNKYNEFVVLDNYHKTAIYDGDDNTPAKVEVFRKGNTLKNIIIINNSKMITQITSSTGGTKTFYDTSTTKEMVYENNNKAFIPLLNDINFMGEEIFIRSLGFPLISEKVDGVECYVLNAKNSMGWAYKGESTKEFKVYIEKETGLVKQIIEKYIIKGEVNTHSIKYTSEYNMVTEKDLSAPSNIGEYIVRN